VFPTIPRDQAEEALPIQAEEAAVSFIHPLSAVLGTVIEPHGISQQSTSSHPARRRRPDADVEFRRRNRIDARHHPLIDRLERRNSSRRERLASPIARLLRIHRIRPSLLTAPTPHVSKPPTNALGV